ncbi:head-tail adaptor protein [Croceicoccus sp. YJ47]|uniref:head-tail adaptor protein n=1 Tax=Croceicoccus sp. YJ47 TaxID=2798724 RepID=UPI0019235368|nr:head-tail adaptor protein [Croceicoccus sp. YJ47]QQN73950.1 head-tail adaptor protein [Croceicoccus sp. YJ47]
MSAGRRRDLIVFERATQVENTLGNVREQWAEYKQEYAAIFYGRGAERRQAAVEQGTQSATFQVRINARTRALTVRDRILFAGVWDIEGIALDAPKRGQMEVTAVRVS